MPTTQQTSIQAVNIYIADLLRWLALQYQHGVDGQLLRTWNGHQINDLALTADGRFLLATPSNGHAVRVYGLHTAVPVERVITAPSAIISISLASDSRHLLARRLLPGITTATSPLQRTHARHGHCDSAAWLLMHTGAVMMVTWAFRLGSCD